MWLWVQHYLSEREVRALAKFRFHLWPEQPWNPCLQFREPVHTGSKLLLEFVGALKAPASSNRRLRPSVSRLLCWNLLALS